MAYTKTTWVDDSAPALSASNLNKIEQGIEDAHDTADTAVQPGDDADTLGSGAATDGQVLTADGAGGAAWETPAGGGTSDHGALTGLADDDHTQYALADGSRGSFATTAQGALADTAVQPGDDADTLGSGAATDGQVLTADGAGGAAWETPAGGGTSDHGALTGLGDDDHTQYALADGSRDITGDLTINTAASPGIILKDDDARLSKLVSVGTAGTHTYTALLAENDSTYLWSATDGAFNVAKSAGVYRRVTGVATPTATEDATSKGYVDASVQAVEGGEARVNVVAASGATETLPAEYAVHKVTMDQNCTFTFPTPTADGAAFRLDLSGAFTPTFPASVDWPDATPPTYASPSSYAFSTNDGGTTWLGTFIGGAFG